MQGLPPTVFFDGESLHLLDQRLLPGEETIRVCQHLDEVIDSIYTLTVRGAPAIGVAAAYGLLTGITQPVSLEALRERGNLLKATRPTAVNLAWAVDRMLGYAEKVNADVPMLIEEARRIHSEDEASCRAIGDHGWELVKNRPRVLTHCNAGALAVSAFGTALAPIYCAHERGVKTHVYVDETRPLLQGSRLTAYELSRSGVPCTLITDNMSGHLMSQGLVDMVIVGADRVARNGDVANKIGTLGVAILCNYFDIPFYVACPWSTIDGQTRRGDSIVIEERDEQEVTSINGQRIAPLGVAVRNPAFDVTPFSLVKGIITESGIVAPGDIDTLLNQRVEASPS